MKEFYITDDGIRLHAKLDMPDGYREGDKCPLALVIHGLTGNMEEAHITGAARTFNELGIASLRVEMYGHGQSEGKFEQHNLFKWLNNIMAVMNYVKTLDFVSGSYICGHSQGGLATMLAAGMYPDVFRAAVILSPASMVPAKAREGQLFKEEFDPLHIPDELYVSDTEKVTGDYVRAVQLIDIDDAVGRFKNPVLIVHGDEDEAIPVMYSEELADKYNDAELVVIKGANHGYDGHLEEVYVAIRKFMNKLL